MSKKNLMKTHKGRSNMKQTELKMKEKEQKEVITDVSKGNETKTNSAERCPWYESVGRILFVLIVTVVSYVFFLSIMSLMLKALNGQIGCWDWICNMMQNNPIPTIVLLGVGYVIFLCSFIYYLTKNLLTNITELEILSDGETQI